MLSVKHDPKTILITGGAGFIGSHTALALLNAGHNLIAIDNFTNSSRESLNRVIQLAGTNSTRSLKVIEGDIRRTSDLEQAFAAAPDRYTIDAVIHFAGLKSVGESVEEPLRYWDINVSGSRQLLETMQKHGCKTLVFSSSATIYGISKEVPTPETAPIKPINPYGHSKAAVEQLLNDINNSESGWRIACLRYFNPVGAHTSGQIGENPRGNPNNLFPLVTRVATGKQEKLMIYGADWETPDGTGIRDYIHVMDLAEGHIAALNTLIAIPPNLITANLGTGKGHSVLQVVRTFEEVSGKRIPYEITGRRSGDAAVSIADPSKASIKFGWKAKRGLLEMCKDAWLWQSNNPNGFN